MRRYKTILEATGRGGAYEKGVMLETPRIQRPERTFTGNRKGLTGIGCVCALLHAVII